MMVKSLILAFAGVRFLLNIFKLILILVEIC